MPKRGKTLNSQCRELVLKLQDYFERESQNGGPLIPVTQVKNRVSQALGIGVKTLYNINKEKFGASGSEDNVLRTPKKKRRQKPVTAQPISGVALASRGLALGGRAMVRRGVYASNPALSPTSSACAAPPVIVTDSYTIANYQKADDKSSVPGEAPAPPALVRQGTETLRRERPHSQLVAPRDPSTTRPNSGASSSQARSSARPTSGPVQKLAPPAPVVDQPRPSTGEVRVSALPRPSRLPAPRRALRPPSVYGAAAGAAELEHY